jgi:hypothetical protein
VNGKAMVLTKKCQKAALGVISEFFGSKTPYNMMRFKNLLLEDLMLLIAKCFFPFCTCENSCM